MTYGNYTYCGEHCLMCRTIESLYCAPIICMPTIPRLKKKQNKRRMSLRVPLRPVVGTASVSFGVPLST